ncbi:hypothetical protein PI125_g222 [Phytophthora idaei]|nr:hypothetical protein PI125_g222 [Phytophthora idaei]
MTTAIDGGLVELAMPPSAQLELAAQHDRYRQLLRSFLARKRRAQTQCERRKRVAAACRVGAVFCQRLFWTKWRAFVAERRQLRREERTGNVQADAENQSQQEEKLDNGECIDLHNEETSAATSSSDEDIDQNKSKAKVLLGRRQHYKRWRLAIKKNEENSEARWVRSLHAIRRWQRFARMKKDRDALQQQAYFFLYYWLLKRSLNQLGRYALVKKRERTLIVKIVKANRQCLLVKTMQQWRLRLLSHQTFSLWRVYVRRRRHQALLYGLIADTLTQCGKLGKPRYISLPKWSLFSVVIKSVRFGEYGTHGVLEHEKRNCGSSKDAVQCVTTIYLFYVKDSLGSEHGIPSDNVHLIEWTLCKTQLILE